MVLQEERCVLWVRGVHERDTPSAVRSQWLEKTQRRSRISGGTVELSVGMTVVVSFDSIELEEAVEFARHAVEDSARAMPPVSVHVGLALGEIGRGGEPQTPTLLGMAFDRAQVLSQRARASEIVLDESAEQRAEELFLFAREVVADRVRGHVLDPVFWSKRACRLALKRLRPAPIPRSAWPVFESMRALAAQPEAQRIALHSATPESALECVDRLIATLNPPLHLALGRCAGALRPLGSLALAVQRRWPDPGDLLHANLPDWLRASLRSLVEGRGMQRSEVVDALMTLVQEHSGAEGRPIIVLEELTEIDPASLGVLAEAAMSPGWNALIVMTLPRGASVPPQLSAANLQDLSLSPLPLDDKIAVAEAVLGLEPGSEIAQRIAHSCGDSAHSVIEAVRTLVSAGDLVQREERFVWRIGPRQGGSAVPVEALITERVSGLIPSAYRVLEIICAAPRHAGREFLEQVAMHDGVNAEEFADGLDPLRVEGFVDDALSLGRGDAALRGALRNIMPPARAAELHRFVADLLRIRMPRPCFGSGELAFHLAEGGQNTAAAAALIDAAHAATEAGFQRVAMRLLATAVDWDGSTQTRKATSELARAVGAAGRPSGRAHSSASTVAAVTVTEEEYEELKSSDLELPSEMAQAAMRSALQAFNHRDYDSVERWLDAAVAAGGGRIAAQRVLAMAHVARGELQDAARTLQRATGNAEVSAAVRARDTLSWSILHLAAGDPQQSVREALSALAQNRTLRDQLGATAALRVLAMGYRVLERAAEAERLEAAAGALGPAAPLASHPA